MRSDLDLEGYFFHAVVFVLFPLVSVIGIATTPANPGSLSIAACRLTNLARPFRAEIGPFSIIEYDTSVHLLIK